MVEKEAMLAVAFGFVAFSVPLLYQDTKHMWQSPPPAAFPPPPPDYGSYTYPDEDDKDAMQAIKSLEAAIVVLGKHHSLTQESLQAVQGIMQKFGHTSLSASDVSASGKESWMTPFSTSPVGEFLLKWNHTVVLHVFKRVGLKGVR